MEIVSAATPNQQRIVAEASIVAIVLHVHAIDSMYKSINFCVDSNPNSAWWDAGGALLVGWPEGKSDGGSNSIGYLLYNVAQFSMRRCWEMQRC